MKVGDTISVTRKVTRRDVAAFSRLSLDDNPIHLDPPTGRTSIFGRNVAHGLLGASLISGALTALCGVGNLWLETELKFEGPIWVDDEPLECLVSINGVTRHRVVDVEVVVLQGTRAVISGTAKCLQTIPEGST